MVQHFCPNTKSLPFRGDSSSCANVDEVYVRHAHLQWNVNFDKKVLEGKCFLDIEVVKDTDHVYLDVRDLDITAVTYKGTPVKHELSDNGPLGQKFALQFAQPLHKGDKDRIEVSYSTSKEGAAALQFIDKDLTADRLRPYLYSQCQAIHARSIAPCMDTPSVKHTYSAEVTVPKGLTCLMSALSEGPKEEKNGLDFYRFNQPIPIPIYLLAIVVGAMEQRAISPRCTVWAEPSVVDKARKEFYETERMLQAAETLMGPYEWNRYDLVVLPPSFPFGGMENPCLTFVTPTLLAGDGSLANVIAHEIAHSYTGNLVTNANWEHFWLNEGFTVFVERKIMGRLHGKQLRDFENITGWEDRLLPTINDVFSPVHEYTKLIPRLCGVDPDDAFSTIPYEKGSAFLLYIEQLVGSDERFEQFLRDYIKEFRRLSIVTEDWIAYLKSYFPDKATEFEAIDWNNWLHSAGVPPAKPKYDESLVTKCKEMAARWASKTVSDEELTLNGDAEVFKGMPSVQQVKVIDCIEADAPISPARVALLEKQFALDKVANCELRFSFLLVGLKAKSTAVVPAALEFVTVYGRLKYVKPIFKKLFDWPESRDQALSTFAKNQPFMHPITANVVKSLIN